MDNIEAAVGQIGRIGRAVGEKMEEQVRVGEALGGLGRMFWWGMVWGSWAGP